jgi:hypothetical protein
VSGSNGHTAATAPTPRPGPGRVWPYGAASPEEFQHKRHWMETLLQRYVVRRLLGWLARAQPDGYTITERIIYSYRNPRWSAWSRLKYWPVHKIIDKLRGNAPVESF